MTKNKLSCLAKAMTITMGVGMSLVPMSGAYADWRGDITDETSDVISAEMYIEAENSLVGIEDLGIHTPSGTVSIRKTASDPSIIDFAEDLDDSCYIHGKKVGRATATCEYLDGNNEVIQTAQVLTHVFVDPNAGPNPSTGEYLDLYVPTGTTYKLSDYLTGYFDNPEEIKPVLCGDDFYNFTITGTTLADAYITAGEENYNNSICLYNPYSNGYNEGKEAMADGNDEFAQVFVQAYTVPELGDVKLIAYGTDEGKTTAYIIEDDGNLPIYEITSNDESIATVEGDYWDGFTIKAVAPGETTMTVTCIGDGAPAQSFKVFVAETAEIGTTTEIVPNTIDESTIDDTSKSAYQTVAGENGIILGYFDVRLVVKDEATGEELDEIAESTSSHKVTLEFPEEMDLPEVADGYQRVFYVIRDHNGVKEKLKATDNGDGTFSFYSDKFSTYVLVYYDVVIEDGESTIVPDTSSEASSGSLVPDTGVVTSNSDGTASGKTAAIITATLVGIVVSVFSLAYLAKRSR